MMDDFLAVSILVLPAPITCITEVGAAGWTDSIDYA